MLPAGERLMSRQQFLKNLEEVKQLLQRLDLSETVEDRQAHCKVFGSMLTASDGILSVSSGIDSAYMFFLS